ncbi:MAG TPA: carbohydrate kinase [Candidatus Hydrogenedentes bacterium]|nr:carbohydrate kinase [Candidatus Hydrogenedentota bacterium]
MGATSYRIVGLGELLWDMLPSGKQMGGAPANFAYHAAGFGAQGLIASRVGEDALGSELRERVEALGFDTRYIQTDPNHPTGTVNVELDAAGQPDYRIVEHVAWDYLAFDASWRTLAGGADAACFGSLIQRHEVARETVTHFLKATRQDCIRIFDVNLRQSFFSRSVIEASLRMSTIVKLNDEEFPRVCGLLGVSEGGVEAQARRLIEQFELELVCITRGAAGSILISSSEIDDHPGYRVEVADTVGSGDAFTAALAHHYLRGARLPRINEAANRLGAWVASQHGATPTLDEGILEDVL